MPLPFISNIFHKNKKRKINTKFKRKNINLIQETVDNYKGIKERWLFNGGSDSYCRSIKMILKNKPITFLKNIKNKKPKILILGAGEGMEALGLYNELRSFGKKPIIDVFSLNTNTLKKELLNKEVRRDLSSNISFEQINKFEHPKLIRLLKDNYDLTIAITSVGVHTKYPEYSVFTSASTLKKGGKTFLEVNKEFKEFKNITDRIFELEDFRNGLKSREFFLRKLLNVKNRKEEQELLNRILKRFINISKRFLKTEYPNREYQIEIIDKNEKKIQFHKSIYSNNKKYVFGSLSFALEITRIK
jgi:hypothetical protein